MVWENHRDWEFFLIGGCMSIKEGYKRLFGRKEMCRREMTSQDVQAADLRFSRQDSTFSLFKL